MSFSSIPPVPQAGLQDWHFRYLDSVKQNVEQLTGQRRADHGAAAVLRGDIDATPVPSLSAAVQFSGAVTVTYTDFHNLLSTVQALINDVESVRQTVNTLIVRMRA